MAKDARSIASLALSAGLGAKLLLYVRVVAFAKRVGRGRGSQLIFGRWPPLEDTIKPRHQAAPFSLLQSGQTLAVGGVQYPAQLVVGQDGWGELGELRLAHAGHRRFPELALLDEPGEEWADAE